MIVDEPSFPSITLSSTITSTCDSSGKEFWTIISPTSSRSERATLSLDDVASAVDSGTVMSKSDVSPAIASASCCSSVYCSLSLYQSNEI